MWLHKQEAGSWLLSFESVCQSFSPQQPEACACLGVLGSELLYFLNGGKEIATKLKISM